MRNDNILTSLLNSLATVLKSVKRAIVSRVKTDRPSPYYTYSKPRIPIKNIVILFFAVAVIMTGSYFIATSMITADNIGTAANTTTQSPEDEEIILTTCGGIVCEDTIRVCSDNYTARCSNTCTDGVCSSCTPDCGGHCTENWKCGEWGPCTNGKQTRVCTDSRLCGTNTGKPSESRACSGSIKVEITGLRYLDPEWVEIKNKGITVNLENWTLKDKALHTYKFRNFILEPNATVKIHTGAGSDTSTDLYWNYNTAVWNNEGDIAFLYNEKNSLVDTYEYPTGSGSGGSSSSDPCADVTCAAISSTCPDGYTASCTPTCSNGVCETCTPDCSDHEDSCAGITCNDTIITCEDGYNATCQNNCTAGVCSNCTPDCSEHDLCANITCNDTIVTCQDGYNATCTNNCTAGVCNNCTPDCTGHQDPCTDVICPDSSLICPDSFNATCLNNCTDGICSNCTPDCSGHEINHVLISEVYYDTVGNDIDEEWFELYNPTTAAIDLTGYTISDNQNTEALPNATIAAGVYLIIARNATGFNALYGCNPDIVLSVGLLSNDGGDQLTLNDGTADVDFVAWEEFVAGWDISAGTDKTIKRIFNRDTDSAADWLSEQTPEPAC